MDPLMSLMLAGHLPPVPISDLERVIFEVKDLQQSLLKLEYPMKKAKLQDALAEFLLENGTNSR